MSALEGVFGQIAPDRHAGQRHRYAGQRWTVWRWRGTLRVVGAADLPHDEPRNVFGGRIGEGRRVVFFRHLDMPARKTRVRELTKNENLERMSIL